MPVLTNPMFTVNRFMGTEEYIIQPELYQVIRSGRTKYTAWDLFVPEGDLQNAMRKSLYKTGVAYVTCADSGTSVQIKHNRSNKILAMTECTCQNLEVSSEFLKEGVEFDFGLDEYYMNAFEYYNAIPHTEDESDMFAQIIAAFIDEVHRDESGQDLAVSFEYAVENVKQGSKELGLSIPTPQIIKDAMQYITDNLEVDEYEILDEPDEVD